MHYIFDALRIKNKINIDFCFLALFRQNLKFKIEAYFANLPEDNGDIDSV